MSVTFLEPGGDAIVSQNFGVNNFFTTGSGGFLQKTDIVHGNYKNSLQANYNSGYLKYALTPAGVVSDSGGRISFWIYVVVSQVLELQIPFAELKKLGQLRLQI